MCIITGENIEMVKEVRPSCLELSLQQWPQEDFSRIKDEKLSDIFPRYSYNIQHYKGFLMLRCCLRT